MTASTVSRISWTATGAALLAGVIAFTSLVEAKQGCTSSKAYADQSTAGTFMYQASTTQAECSGRTTFVLAWFKNGAPFECSGQRDLFGNCQASDASGTATTTAYNQGCGTVDAASYHSYTQGGVTTSLGWTDPVHLSSPCRVRLPDPQGDCSAFGNEYYWDGDGGRCIPLNCPIVIATGTSQEYRLTSAAGGVFFDITGEGRLDLVAWTEADAEVAFLALDRDGDGQITSGRELFGDHAVPGATNGFDALMRTAMESNGGVKRGSVSSDDPVFSRLLLWTDRNHNGISEAAELRRAADLVSDIGLSYQVHNRRDGFGNHYRFRGYVLRRTAPGRNSALSPLDADSRRRWIYDAFLTTAQK